MFLSRSSEAYGYFSVKTVGQNFNHTVDRIKEVYNKYFTSQPFDFFTLNDNIRTNYSQDYLLRTVLMIFTGIAIILSCLGLFALTSLLLIKRTKEIGIRKVLGASFADIFRKLSKGYIGLLLISALVAIPLTWYVLSEWLNNYAVRIDLSWDYFLLSQVGSPPHNSRTPRRNPVVQSPRVWRSLYRRPLGKSSRR